MKIDVDNLVFHLGWTGSVASLVSLAMSVWVLKSVRGLRATLNMRIRLPEIMESLNKQATDLKGHVSKKRWSQAHSSLARSDADLRSLSKWIRDKQLSKQIVDVRAQITQVGRTGITENTTTAIMQLISGIAGINQSLEHVRKDAEVSDS